MMNALRSIFVIAACLLSQTARADGLPAGLDGSWVGRCQVNGADVYVAMRLQKAGGRITGMAGCRRLGIRRASLSGQQTDDECVTVSFPMGQDHVQLDCRLQGDELRGTALADGKSGPCSFRRSIPMDSTAFEKLRGDYQLSAERVLLVGRYDIPNYFFLTDGDLRLQLVPVGPREFLSEDLRTIHFEVDDGGTAVALNISQAGQPAQRAPRVRLYEQETVSFSNGDVRLVGNLTIPKGPGPHPAVVFVHGSGPGRREQNVVEADLFARHGIASLAYDKRGCGESTGDWRLVDFNPLADDVVEAVHCLQRDRRIRADKIGLYGVSQAGWIIPLAAARSSDVAFIVPVSGNALTPAEQELWRQRQNLEYLGVPERFIELERKSAAMAFDWQRQNQLGRMLIPNFFADDNLNMFHDAEAVLRQVRQPVLAIWGGMDTLTPPQESAAIFADILRQRGNDDFSVRVFPRGSHGLFDGGKTGSPLEVFPETRWVPGYADTLVRWILHHVDGPPFADARRIDVDTATIPVESAGMHRVPWYGSGTVQPWQLVGSFVIFASAVFAAPALALWRRIRRSKEMQPPGTRRTGWLAALLGVVNVAILVAMTYVFYQLIQAQPHPLFGHLSLVWNGLAAATWLSLILVVLIARDCLKAWRIGWWSRGARLYYSAVALSGVLWIPFVLYWDLLWPTW